MPDAIALKKPAILILKWVLISSLVVCCGGGSADVAGSAKADAINATDSPRSDFRPEKKREPYRFKVIRDRSTSEESVHLTAAPISRVDLLVVLEEGIPRFLQNIRVEPRFSDGRFFGWQVISLFPEDPRFSRSSVRPGDVVIDVNGHSIERPEGLKDLWDELATSNNLRFTVLREGQAYVIDHEITD